jgi:hypothetical protein
MQYWSEDLGVWIEGEAQTFTGPDATHFIIDREGWVQKRNAVLDVAPSRTKAERGPQQPRMKPEPTKLPCRAGCGGVLSTADLRSKRKRCKGCRRYKVAVAA